MSGLGRFISRLIDLFTNLGGIFIIVMMIHITVDVILRYFFHSAVEGTIEIVSNYYMIIIGFLSLCFTEEKNRNISVELVTDMMPKWLQRHLEGFSYLFALVIFGFLAVRTFIEAGKKQAVGAFVTQGTSDVVIWPAYYIIPLGCVLVLIVVAYKLACYVTGSESGLNEKLEDADPSAEYGVPQ
jgi:TRAP-type C4-dicarboxylate transport system permease small subunit